VTRWLERRALAKLRARFEGAEPARATPDEVGRDLKVAGTRFRVRERGPLDGRPPVVLLPEAGFSARMLEPIAADLAARGRRVLSIDLPGFGGARRRVRGLEPERVARQLESLLDALRVARADFCAAGWGARVARALVERAPPRVTRLVALDAERASFAAEPEALRAELGARLPRALPPALRQELEAELAAAPAGNLALVLPALRSTPIGVGSSLGADEALAPGRVFAELSRD
jgi:pimeloyl-ACP methyl ester carboxylesterase